MPSDDEDARLAGGVEVPTSALNPLGLGVGVESRPSDRPQRDPASIRVRPLVSIIMVLAGVVLALIAAAMVSMVALLATLSVLLLVVGFALGYEGD